MPMMAITTKSSTRVKPRWRRRVMRFVPVTMFNSLVMFEPRTYVRDAQRDWPLSTLGIRYVGYEILVIAPRNSPRTLTRRDPTDLDPATNLRTITKTRNPPALSASPNRLRNRLPPGLRLCSHLRLLILPQSRLAFQRNFCRFVTWPRRKNQPENHGASRFGPVSGAAETIELSRQFHTNPVHFELSVPSAEYL